VRTNIEIDDQLLSDAMRSSGARTKKAAVEAGLRLLVKTHSQAAIRRLRGKVQWEGDLNELLTMFVRRSTALLLPSV
jgi:Arc/MetJ family transcription regulator